MGKGKAIAKMAAIGAAIAGVVFFWRKRHPHPGADTPPTAADIPPAE